MLCDGGVDGLLEQLKTSKKMKKWVSPDTAERSGHCPHMSTAAI